VIYASLSTASVGKLFIAGLVPGLLLGVFFLFTVGLTARRRGFPVGPRQDRYWSTLSRSVLSNTPALVLPVVIVGGIRFGLFTATEAAAVGCVYSLLVGVLIYRDLTVRRLWRALRDTAAMTGVVMLIVGAAAPLSWYLAFNRAPQRLASGISEIAGPVTFMLAAAALVAIAGALLEATALLILTTPLLTRRGVARYRPGPLRHRDDPHDRPRQHQPADGADGLHRERDQRCPRRADLPRRAALHPGDRRARAVRDLLPGSDDGRRRTVRAMTVSPMTLTRRLIESRLRSGDPDAPGDELELTVDQVLLNDTSGPLIVLALDAIGRPADTVGTVVAYMDHLLIQQDERYSEDHELMRSACERYGFWYAPPGSGVAHPVHQQHFGVPGTVLVGSDSHTPAAGAIGQLAVGLGGLRVAEILAGAPLRISAPRVWGVEVVGRLQANVSAKDVVLEMLRRHGVSGANGYVLEYHGEGLADLGCMDRHVIANMGTELGALTSVFPSDEVVHRFLVAHGRGEAWRALSPDAGARYDRHEVLDLSTIVPMIALPGSPGNAVPVTSVAGEPIVQAYVGSSGNPGLRDLAAVVGILGEGRVAPGVSLDINPASRSALIAAIEQGIVQGIIRGGGRLHETGCNGCIGLGQAPLRAGRSLRTVPRNFPGRSGTLDDRIHLVSPETAAASALTGRITDPRELPPLPRWSEPDEAPTDWRNLIAPPSPEQSHPLRRGDGHVEFPSLPPVDDAFEVPVILLMADDVSTDDILAGGTGVLPVWSRLGDLRHHAFRPLDPGYVARAERAGEGHAIVAGSNYGQGSSREHAALAPRLNGLRVALAVSFARIHLENLVSFGVLPLTIDPAIARGLEVGSRLTFSGVRAALASREGTVSVTVSGTHESFEAVVPVGPTSRATIAAGGILAELQGRDRTVGAR
jgi:aconitate hydratase